MWKIRTRDRHGLFNNVESMGMAELVFRRALLVIISENKIFHHCIGSIL